MRSSPATRFKVTVDVTNHSAQSGSFSAILQVKGPGGAAFQPEQVKEITLAAGQKGQISFFLVKEGLGRYEVKVEGQLGAFDVVRKLNPANLSFSQLRFSVSPEDEKRLKELGLTPPTEVTPGTPVTMAAFVSNNGDLDGRAELGLRINGALAQTRSVALPGRGGVDVSFVFTPPADGTYVVELIELDQVVAPLRGTIKAVTPGKPAPIGYSRLAIEPLEVELGGAVSVSVLLTNPGETAVTETVTLLLNGQPVIAKEVIIQQLSAVPVSFTIKAPDLVGEYKIEVGPLAGALRVTQPRAPTPIPPPTSTPFPAILVIQPGQVLPFQVSLRFLKTPQELGLKSNDRITLTALFRAAGPVVLPLTPTPTPAPFLTQELLPSLILPLSDVQEAFPGFQVDINSSGYEDNAAAAEGSIDPQDTGADLAARGRIVGYNVDFTDPNDAIGVGVSSSVDLFRSPEATRASIQRQIKDFKQFEGTEISEGVLFKSFEETVPPGVGEDAVAGRLTYLFRPST